MRLVLAPEFGGSIVSWCRGDQALIKGRSGEANLGCFPMVPYCNRIAYGRFKFHERDVVLTPNFPGEQHTIHGTTWRKPWCVESQCANEIGLSYEHDALASAQSGWPWTFRAEQTFQLTQNSLLVHLRVTNTDIQPMPAGLGLHPFFPAPERTQLVSQFSHELRVDREGIPIDKPRLVGSGDPLNGGQVGEQSIDNIFLGKVVAPVLQWANQPWKLQISASEELPHTVIFAPQAEGFVCIEPISHVPNILNATMAVGDLDDMQMRVLASNEAFAASVEFITLENV